jgi:uncharacterized protein YbaP (TraB family)
MISFLRSRLLVALLFATCGGFFAGAAEQKPAAPGASTGKHFLWRATDVPVPFYILGSYHALRAKDYPLGHEIDEAIGQSKRFLYEMDFDHDAAVFAKKMHDAAIYPAGVSLRQKISPKTYAYLQKIAQTRASSYDGVKPWAIAFFMYGNKAVHDIYGYFGVEQYIRRKASSFADIGGLETPEEHVRVLSDMSDIEGEVFLLQTMVYGDAQARDFDEGVRLWKHGDIHGLARSQYRQEHEAPYLVQRLITKRNANWIPKIEAEMHTGKPTMIVVGARHLCGPYNVIDLLRSRGHKLEQL